MRIQLTRRGDYAVRAAVVLSRPGAGQMTSAELAAATGIPASFVPQVMGDLVRANLVANRRGRLGGYRLSRAAAEISLLDIVEAADGRATRTCVLRGGPCRRDGECDVHGAFFGAERAAFGALAAVTLDGIGERGLGLPPMRSTATDDRAARQLQALDEAVRGISGVLDVDRVLQLIADRVRDLAEAEYAAIGIVDADGAIERFITSGISDEARARIGDLPHGRGLLGLIIRENRTYRIPDIAAHPESYGFPPNHPPMTSFLGMPIRASGATVGRLYLTNKIAAAEFSADDQDLVERFALHAGIAIENARLHDQVRRLAVVDERDRISRDLHDSIIQAIYAQTLALDDVPELIGDEPDEARRRTDEAIEALHAVIRDIRNFIFGLRPVLLESGSLADGLERLATELRRNGGVEVEVSVDADPADLEGLRLEVVAELLAITREALSNIARHAAATHADVGLRASPDALRLEITDDGRGFDAEAHGSAGSGHHGLVNMRARTEALGGRFALDSGIGGTRMIITLPRRAAIEEDA
jgi:Rrf2 family protein